MDDAAAVVRDLLSRYIAEPQQMAHGWSQLAPGLDERRLARLAADFVAGMTDRYALGEHRRLFAVTPQLR
jgi:dGTPase